MRLSHYSIALANICYSSSFESYHLLQSGGHAMKATVTVRDPHLIDDGISKGKWCQAGTSYFATMQVAWWSNSRIERDWQNRNKRT
jgi:hypothetical protein